MPDTQSVSTRQLLASLASLLLTLVVIFGLEFWPAGTLDWPAGRDFYLVFVTAIFVSLVYLWQANPEIFVARSRVAAGTKLWDYIFLVLVIGSFVAVFIVAALDWRDEGTRVPDWLVWIGYLLFFAGFAIIVQAQAANRHFEPSVRIQTDRGHTVIDTGPYAVIRHPGYISGSMLILGAAIGLGSFWAIVPALVAIASLAVRTLREEATLRAELPGYTEYTQRVRWRWVPGVW